MGSYTILGVLSFFVGLVILLLGFVFFYLSIFVFMEEMISGVVGFLSSLILVAESLYLFEASKILIMMEGGKK